ncbi:penicillin-insensitive murein endopeptidase [Amaricoccus macauensis]|uniref:Penicillin-insensitive murein endopeptidase n=1 Tax=Amaricoccus macauensis TaxID=57001 RepID=A0A840SEP6_9RHOB|nr:penicillin-insensitive murein endopeptidase [Amaricoccus macauensis]MBB5220287.1 penicillin-insensitive murein endopeptidase [Amaricoccus macauensis]
MISRLMAACLALALLTMPAGAVETARELFAQPDLPSALPTYSIGAPGQGCLAGGVPLAESGPTWQAMRLSRNHQWGHPVMIDFIKDLSRFAARQPGWAGLYVGDIAQPRGGPVKGHASHQTGLDADIWYLRPTRLDLTARERERLSANNVKARDERNVNAEWTPQNAAILEAAARDPRVNRIFVTAPVKLAMCAEASRRDRAWLGKIRPWWGHDDHFHVRLNCPRGAAGCVPQAAVPAGDGCKDAIWWVTEALEPPDPNAPKTQPKPPLTLTDLPPQCTQVLRAR